MNIKRQLKSIESYSFSSALTVTGAVWVALLAGRGFALWQIGLAEGIFHVVSLLGEVPSGMAADLLGRRRTLVVSGLLAAASSLTMANARHFGVICAAMGLSALSYNLMSGTREAILYDSLKQAGQEDRYLQQDAVNCQLTTLGTALGNAASLLVNALGFAGMYLLNAALGLMRSVCALCMEEPVVTEQQAARSREPLRTLPARLVRLCRKTAAYLQGSPQVARCIAANAVVTLPCYLTTMFLQQRLVELGLPAIWLGLPMLPVVLGAGLAQFVTSLWMLHAEKWLNDQYPSDQRATLVSVDSMAYSVLMIPASPLVGLVSDVTGHAGAGLCLLGAAVALSAAGALAHKKIPL